MFIRKLGDIVLALVALGVLIMVAAKTPPVNHAGPVEGSARVADGDTLVVNGVRVRLRGIDTPELAQTCIVDGTTYPCGRQAEAALIQLVSGRAITCENHGNDRYGRVLGRCMAGSTELNHAMVEAGWAVAYGDYNAQERAARQARQGLWRGEFMPPQDWRRNHAGEVEPAHDWFSSLHDWLSRVFGF